MEIYIGNSSCIYLLIVAVFITKPHAANAFTKRPNRMGGENK